VWSLLRLPVIWWVREAGQGCTRSLNSKMRMLSRSFWKVVRKLLESCPKASRKLSESFRQLSRGFSESIYTGFQLFSNHPPLKPFLPTAFHQSFPPTQTPQSIPHSSCRSIYRQVPLIPQGRSLYLPHPSLDSSNQYTSAPYSHAGRHSRLQYLQRRLLHPSPF